MEEVEIIALPLEVSKERERMINEWRMQPKYWQKPWPGFVEIHRLERLLIEADIPYKKIVKLGGWLIYYDNKDGGMAGDVIEHTGSYGNEEDLLEAAGFDIDVEEGIVGWLTAREAFEYFKRCHETRQKTE